MSAHALSRLVVRGKTRYHRKAYSQTERVLKVGWLMKYRLNVRRMSERLAVSKRTIKRDRSWLRRRGLHLIKEAA